MRPQEARDELISSEACQAPTADVVPLRRPKHQSDILQPNENMSEFEWARVTSKTWDMEQG